MHVNPNNSLVKQYTFHRMRGDDVFNIRHVHRDSKSWIDWLFPDHTVEHFDKLLEFLVDFFGIEYIKTTDENNFVIYYFDFKKSDYEI